MDHFKRNPVTTDEPNSSAELRIRFATIDDFADILELSRLQHLEGFFKHIPFSEKKVKILVDRCLQDGSNSVLILATRKGRAIGQIYATAGEYFVGERDLITSVYAFYIHPDIRNSLVGGKAAIRLIRAIRKWSNEIGTQHLLFHVTQGTHADRTDRFLRRVGLKTLGGNYGV